MRKQIDLAKKSKSVAAIKKTPELPPTPQAPSEPSLAPELEGPTYEPQPDDNPVPEKRSSSWVTYLFVVILLIVIGFIAYQFFVNR